MKKIENILKYWKAHLCKKIELDALYARNPVAQTE